LQPDLYELLEVGRDATAEELKKAYRRQARRFHPDLNPDDAEAERRFKEVTWAYQVLSDATRRTQYDRFGRVFTDGRSQGPFGTSEEVDLGSLFGNVVRDLFGSRKKRPGRRRQDLRYTVTVTLEEAGRGTDKPIKFTRKMADGSRHEEHLKVKVPAGVETGQKLKVRGKGVGIGAAIGDLFVVVNVADHEYFRRRGADVFCDLPVSYAQALLGAELAVPTIHGPSTIRLPPSTRPGTVLTLKGKGLPRLGRGGRRPGDQFVKVVLEMPDEVPGDVRDQLLALDRALAANRSELREQYERFLGGNASEERS
jgi:DnaJ-class molecular chaperone